MFPDPVARVVDAVAGHHDDAAGLAQEAHDVELVPRGHAVEDGDAREHGRDVRLVARVAAWAANKRGLPLSPSQLWSRLSRITSLSRQKHLPDETSRRDEHPEVGP